MSYTPNHDTFLDEEAELGAFNLSSIGGALASAGRTMSSALGVKPVSQTQSGTAAARPAVVVSKPSSSQQTGAIGSILNQVRSGQVVVGTSKPKPVVVGAKPSTSASKPTASKSTTSVLGAALARQGVSKATATKASIPKAVQQSVAKLPVGVGTRPIAAAQAEQKNTLANVAAGAACGGAIGGVPGALLGGALGLIMERLGPDVNAINARLLAQDLQRMATNEHRSIMRRRSFEDEVRRDLVDIKGRLGTAYYTQNARAILDPRGGY